MPKVMTSQDKTEQTKLKAYRALVIGTLLLVMAGALSIPFVYESQTLWYKIGLDKTLLRGGQMVGLLAAVLLFVQILLAVRGKFLKELFGIAALMRWHRTNGIIIPILAVSHALLILAPEGLTNLPIGKKYWPELVGMLLLCIVVAMAVSAQFREKLRLDYKRWRAIHKLLGYLVIIFLVVHVLFVSESFEQIVPRTALLALLAGVVSSIILSKKIK